MPLESPSRDELKELLGVYNESPSERERIEAEINRTFRHKVAILVLDTSGFTRTTRVYGIVHFLALLERLERMVVPTIERFGGKHLKTDADNIFGAFADASSAVDCADSILNDTTAVNVILPASDEIYVSIGIGFGDSLLIGSEDSYGDETNLACKLGEYLADKGEVLLTQAAYDNMGETTRKFQELRLSVSGLLLVAHKLVR
ncbi:MAG: adenylate/guanylate cyclase domain-containing protein [Dehalococcoidia bacterium]|nr:adenylate/guanylate cyclase domain-containing protein [Dehalococcoidia bacterium]